MLNIDKVVISKVFNVSAIIIDNIMSAADVNADRLISFLNKLNVN